MAKYDSASYTSTGEKAVITTKIDRVTQVGIVAPSTAKYDIEIMYDTGGQRHKLLEHTGDYNAFIPRAIAAIGLNVTEYVSGTIEFEILSEITLTL